MKTHAHIYVLQAPNGIIKLGHAKNVETRVKGLPSHQRRSVSIAHVTPKIDAAERVERMANKLLALDRKRLRRNGEWFVASVSDAVASIEWAVRIIDGFDVEPFWPTKPVSRSVPITIKLENWLIVGMSIAFEDERYPPSRSKVAAEAVKSYLLDRGIVSNDKRVLARLKEMREGAK